MKHLETDTVYTADLKIKKTVFFVLKAFECDLTIDKTLGKHRKAAQNVLFSLVMNLLKVELVIIFQCSLSTFVKPIEPIENQQIK